VTEEKAIFRFGDCELDPALRELRRAGQPVSVQRKVFDLLLYLLENRDRAVDKDEIQEAVWPGVIVTETALTRAIMKARRAVGDDADAQAVLRTVHGHGYRFVADVEETGQAPPAPAAAPATEPTAGPPGPGPASPAPASRVPEDRGWHRWAFVALVVLALVAAFWTLAPEPPPETGRRLAVLPVENATGDAEAAWAELGIMGVVGQMLRSAGVQVVPTSQVLGMAERELPEGELDDRLRRAFGATHVVASKLERSAGLYRLSWEMRSPEGRPLRRTLVGEDVARLGRDFGADLLASTAPDKVLPRREVSDDPFVNEAYARGLSLQLQGKAQEARPLFEAAASQAPGAFWPRYEYALTLRILGENEEAGRLLREVLEEARGQGRPAEQAAALNGLAVLQWRLGDLAAAEALLSEGMPLALEAGDLTAAGTMLVNMAILAKNRGDLAQAESYLDRSEALYREAGYEEAPGALHNTRATILDMQGRMPEADAAFEAALRAFRIQGEERHEATVLRNLAGVRFQQGRWDDAERLTRDALTLQEALGDRRGQASTLEGLAEIELARGRVSLAQGHAVRALELARDTKTRTLEARALGRLGDVQRARGDLDTARQSYLEARDLFEAADEISGTMGRWLDLAALELDAGNAAASAEAAGQVADRARALGLEAWQARARVALGRALAAADDPGEARALFIGALEDGRRLGEPDVVAAASAALTETLLDAREVEAAAAHLRRYAELRPQTGQRWILEARLAGARGEHGPALENMERAREALGERWTRENEAELEATRVRAASD